MASVWLICWFQSDLLIRLWHIQVVVRRTIRIYKNGKCDLLFWQQLQILDVRIFCNWDLVSNSSKSLISVLNRHHINSQMNFSQIPKSWKSLMWEFGLMWKWSGAAGGCVPLTIRSSLGQASRRAELGNSTNRKFTKKIAQKQCLEFCLNIVQNAK